jgi:hypothetical protein
MRCTVGRRRESRDVAALVLVRVTGNPLFDSIFGVTVAGWIAWNSLYLLWNAGNDLMDVALPNEEVAAVIEAIERTDPSVTGYRELRTRRAAGVRFIDFELCIDRNASFEHAHDVTERVKASIQERFADGGDDSRRAGVVTGTAGVSPADRAGARARAREERSSCGAGETPARQPPGRRRSEYRAPGHSVQGSIAEVV